MAASPWNDAIEAALAQIERLRCSGCGKMGDARFSGQRGIDHADALLDAYQAVTKLKKFGPRRIQRQRIKGWRMPENTVYVGRPTKFGNPFVVGESGGAYAPIVHDRRHAYQLFRSVAFDNQGLVASARAELRGKNLACFCPLPTEPYQDDCCHAAVLLEIANGPEARAA
jgi:hypothetical protein